MDSELVDDIEESTSAAADREGSPIKFIAPSASPPRRAPEAHK